MPSDSNIRPRLFLVVGPPTWRAASLAEVTGDSASPLNPQQTSTFNVINPVNVGAGLGAALVDAIIDADNGKYMLLQDNSDDAFAAKIRAFAKVQQ